MTGTNHAAPGSYPDPFGRHARRWWDGEQWTDRVSDNGTETFDPPVPGPPAYVGSDAGGKRASTPLELYRQLPGGLAFTGPLMVGLLLIALIVTAVTAEPETEVDNVAAPAAEQKLLTATTVDETTTTAAPPTTEATTTSAAPTTTTTPPPTTTTQAPTTLPPAPPPPPPTAPPPTVARFVAPPPAASTGCDPNYSPCVPMFPPDVDCGDLSSSVNVIGSDPHGLDRDGDGVGCESN